MNKKFRVISLCTALTILILLLKILHEKQFTSVEDFRAYTEDFGIAGLLALTAFQVFQAVFPIMPDFFGCAAGAVAFGSEISFLCSYAGICSGSIIAYFLGRRYGKAIMNTLFSEKACLKWNAKTEKSRSYERLLFISVILPLIPDCYLCYYSGLIKMDSKKFIRIILLAKPWSILVYSLLFGLIK